MEKKTVKTKDAPMPIGPYSQGVIAGNFLFVSGQGPIDPKTGKVPRGFSKQTRQTLENIKNILRAAGLSLENVVKVIIFLKDMRKYEIMNKIYKEYFKSNPPARTTVQATLPKDISIEIEVIAFMPE